MFWCLCLKRSHKDRLFKLGVQKLEKEFEITKMVKKIRQVSLLSQIFLSKYQLKLTPYFPKNILKERTIQNASFKIPSHRKGKTQLSEAELDSCLQQVISKVRQSKVDKRILKNLSMYKEKASSAKLENFFCSIKEESKIQNSEDLEH